MRYIYIYICACVCVSVFVCVCVCVCVCVMEYYSAIKNNEILPIATRWLDLEGIMLSEITQIEKDKYCMISLTCRIQKTKQMNKQN